MVDGSPANGAPSDSPSSRSEPSRTALEIAAGLGVFVFLYLTIAGIDGFGAGDVVPTVVSRAVGLGVLLLGLGTAFVNAYRGGRLTASVASPLALAVGLSLFLVVSDIFQSSAVEADLPTHLSVLFYLLVGGAVGLVIHLLGKGVNRVASRTIGSSCDS